MKLMIGANVSDPSVHTLALEETITKIGIIDAFVEAMVDIKHLREVEDILFQMQVDGIIIGYFVTEIKIGTNTNSEHKVDPAIDKAYENYSGNLPPLTRDK